MIQPQRDRVLWNGELLHVRSIPAYQPEHPNALHLHVNASQWGMDSPDEFVRCERIAGTWTATGLQPHPRNVSWHPDLPDALAEYVAVCRHVAASIDGCGRISVRLRAIRTGGSADSVESYAFFMMTDPGDPSSMSGIVPDRMLDTTPFVRHVENEGTVFSDFFGLDPYDDGSGISGDMDLEVGPSLLRLRIETSDDNVLSLSSDADGEGRWTHATAISLWTPEADAVEQLRRHADPTAFALSIVEDSDLVQAYHRHAGLRCRGFSEDKPHVTTFDIVPGTLLGSDKSIERELQSED